MRTITTAQDEVLTRGKYKVELRVEIEDSTSTLVDVSDFEGQNWIKSVEISDDVDASVSTATIKLFAQRYNLSMHPLDEDSKINLPSGVYAPFLDVRRQIRVLAATVPQDYTAVTADFELIFDGFIDMIPESGKSRNEIALACRDKGGVLQDTWIEDLERYGDGSIDDTDNTIGGGLLEDIIQDIFDNWVPGITLFSENGTGGTPFLGGDSPGFVVEGWDVDIQSVMDAIRIGANSIGWECRYRFQDNQGEFEVQLYEPDRVSAVVDRTFSPSEYIDVANFDVDISKVRNVIEITYYTDPDAEPATLEVSDAASITRYGRRWFGIVEAASSAINTAGEAGQMASAILADLREPDRDQSIEMPLFWAVQLGDRYTFKANGVNYSTDQTWAVVGYKHFLEQGRQRTIIETRRAPSGGVIHWWDKGQIGGLGGLFKDKPPTTPVPTLDILDHGILVEWDSTLSRASKIAVYEVHASTVGAGFTPDASTLVAKTRGTRYRINGLDQRTEYFVKIISVDEEGNVGSTSGAVSNEPGFLRGFPGIISTGIPDETTLQPGQMVMTSVDGKQGQMLRRWDETYQDLSLQTTTQEPTAYYKQNESAGPTATDESSNGNDGTYSAGVSFGQGPIVPNGAANNAGYFGSHRIDLDDLALTGLTAMSWEAWLELTPAIGGGWTAATVFNIFDCDNPAGTSQWQALFQAGANPKAAILNVRVGNILRLFTVATAQDFFTDGPVHMAITWNNSDGFIHVYRNGELLTTSPATHASGTVDIDDCTFFNEQAGASSRAIGGLSDHMIFWAGAEIPAAEIKERVDLTSQPDVRYERVTPVTQAVGKYFNSTAQVAAATGATIEFDSPAIELGMTVTTVGANLGRVTVNVEGWYDIGLCLVLEAMVVSAAKFAAVRVNGSANNAVVTNRDAGQASTHLTGNGKIWLNAGDFIEVILILSSGTANILASSEAATNSYLHIERRREGMGQN